MKKEIIIELICNMYGTVAARIIFPDFSAPARIAKCYELWHITIPRNSDETGKGEAWLAAANKLHLTAAEMRRLRKHRELRLPAPDVESMKIEWQRIHTRNKDMTQRFNTPNLCNI